jgi:hypothetical protein
MKYFSASSLIIFVFLLLALFATPAAGKSGLDHPCHPGGTGGPGGPGVPPAICPTPLPPTEGGDQEANRLPKTMPVGFHLINRTAENITLWLGSPIKYVLNVPAGTESIFTIDRNVYAYSLRSCGSQSDGFMDLTVKSFFEIPGCAQVDLARISLENRSNWSLEVMLEGADDYVLFMLPGQSRVLTVAKGEYEVTYQGCLQSSAPLYLRARANAQLSLNCH